MKVNAIYEQKSQTPQFLAKLKDKCAVTKKALDAKMLEVLDQEASTLERKKDMEKSKDLKKAQAMAQKAERLREHQKKLQDELRAKEQQEEEEKKNLALQQIERNVDFMEMANRDTVSGGCIDYLEAFRNSASGEDSYVPNRRPMVHPSIPALAPPKTAVPNVIARAGTIAAPKGAVKAAGTVAAPKGAAGTVAAPKGGAAGTVAAPKGAAPDPAEKDKDKWSEWWNNGGAEGNGDWWNDWWQDETKKPLPKSTLTPLRANIAKPPPPAPGDEPPDELFDNLKKGDKALEEKPDDPMDFELPPITEEELGPMDIGMDEEEEPWKEEDEWQEEEDKAVGTPQAAEKKEKEDSKVITIEDNPPREETKDDERQLILAQMEMDHEQERKAQAKTHDDAEKVMRASILSENQLLIDARLAAGVETCAELPESKQALYRQHLIRLEEFKRMLETHRNAKREMEEKHASRLEDMSRQLSSAELAIPEHNEEWEDEDEVKSNASDCSYKRLLDAIQVEQAAMDLDQQCQDDHGMSKYTDDVNGEREALLVSFYSNDHRRDVVRELEHLVPPMTSSAIKQMCEIKPDWTSMPTEKAQEFYVEHYVVTHILTNNNRKVTSDATVPTEGKCRYVPYVKGNCDTCCASFVGLYESNEHLRFIRRCGQCHAFGN